MKITRYFRVLTISRHTRNLLR